MKRSRLASSEESSLKTCREVERNGFRYLKVSFVWGPTPRVEVSKPLMTFLKLLTVSWSSVLKSWSRSTSETVAESGSSPPSGISAPCLSPSGICREM